MGNNSSDDKKSAYLEEADNDFQDYLMKLLKKMSDNVEKKRSSGKSNSDTSIKANASPSFMPKI